MKREFHTRVTSVLLEFFNDLCTMGAIIKLKLGKTECQNKGKTQKIKKRMKRRGKMQFGDLKLAEVMWLRHLWSVLAHPKIQM